jgi:hypothetical protein
VELELVVQRFSPRDMELGQVAQLELEQLGARSARLGMVVEQALELRLVEVEELELVDEQFARQGKDGELVGSLHMVEELELDMAHRRGLGLELGHNEERVAQRFFQQALALVAAPLAPGTLNMVVGERQDKGVERVDPRSVQPARALAQLEQLDMVWGEELEPEQGRVEQLRRVEEHQQGEELAHQQFVRLHMVGEHALERGQGTVGGHAGSPHRAQEHLGELELEYGALG